MTKHIIIILIKVYQYSISPLLGPRCRFNPTCSNYTIDAFKKHSIFKASSLSFKRIIKCHPWGNSGDDPVPD